ncbi:hypothetical protein FOL47_000420 [Perkinsus chesapeaki]|uniref:Uncharacterized protein n=1 Tax=Perkinsus chesapeaki TaxID=330153 RepID=A0A7J6MLU2_PERCH|nr:hypothetical protein FOL47_000420 [Perkinsus chesapeaki]
MQQNRQLTTRSAVMEWVNPTGEGYNEFSPPTYIEGVVINSSGLPYQSCADFRAWSGKGAFLPLKILTNVNMFPPQHASPTAALCSQGTTVASTPSSVQRPKRRLIPRLGNSGRSKLRGKISAASRTLTREQKAALGVKCLKTATVAELVEMADKVGLVDYIDALIEKQYGPP